MKNILLIITIFIFAFSNCTKEFVVDIRSIPPEGGTVLPSQGTYKEGSTVTLIAKPNLEFRFTGWSGDAIGSSSPIHVIVDDNKNVAANFSLVQYDPIKAIWLSEYPVTYCFGDSLEEGEIDPSNTGQSDNGVCSTSYRQKILLFSDENVNTKDKGIFEGSENLDPETVGFSWYADETEFSWTNNDPNCSPANCINYSKEIQEYTIDLEIVKVVFSNPIEIDLGRNIFNKMIIDGLSYDRVEELIWINF